MSEQEGLTAKKSKKTLIIIIIVVAALILALLATSIFIDIYSNNTADNDILIDYDFYPVDYDEDIYSDYEYVGKITGEFMKYYDPTGDSAVIGIDKETANEKGGDELQFIVDMLYEVIGGDYESYNERFSDVYYQKNQPKERFTKQKIYDVMITYVPEYSEEVDNYTKSVYCVEYKILKNNGTFRKDIGAGSKKQYITLTNRSGNLLIDSIVTENRQFVQK